MILRALRHVGFAVWLGVIALAASGIEQGQLSANIVTAAMDDAAMMAKMGHDMAHHHGAGGHTHKGHADCEVCALSRPAFVTVSVASPVRRRKSSRKRRTPSPLNSFCPRRALRPTPPAHLL